MKAHRRQDSSEDLESHEPRTSPSTRLRAPRTDSYNGARGGKGGSAPFFLILVILFGMGIIYQVYQFSVSMPQHPPLREPFYNKTMVKVTTKFGPFTIELYPTHAPKSVETFMKLIDHGFYTEQAGFYRNEPNFLLQGGGFLVDKISPFPNVPVEYSIPCYKRMVVVARGQRADSGNSEFAILLHDALEFNAPNAENPGYTVFGRVVEGWHTIEHISKKMKPGFLAKSDQARQIMFDKVEYVERLSNDNEHVKERIEHLTYVLETKHTINIISELDCAETTKLKALFAELKALVRVEEIGYSAAHPYEHETVHAMTGTTRLPLVYINHKLIGGLAEIEQMKKLGTLVPLLEESGTLAETIAWNAIHQNPLVMFSKSYCPYCKKAKEILAGVGAKPLVYELDLRKDGVAMQDFLFQLTGQSTVPNVFIKGKTIGGADNTAALLKSGELVERLKRAGAIPRD